MSAVEVLVLRGWLGRAAPRLLAHPDAPQEALARDALARLAPLYGGEEMLTTAIIGALRRAAVQALAELRVLPDAAELRRAQQAILGAEALIRAPLQEEGLSLERALRQALDSVEAITGLGPLLVPGTLRGFEREVREAIPREEPLALQPAVLVLESWLPRLSPGARTAAERDLGGLYSQLGRRGEARARFEAAGETARALLEECDEALEAGRWPVATALANLCVQAAEAPDGTDDLLLAAALRRLASIAEYHRDLRRAEGYLHRSLEAARRLSSTDPGAEAAALEELSRLASDQGQQAAAVSWLGRLWQLERRTGRPGGQERALRLAGRLLAEGGAPAQGLVLLLEAHALAEQHNPQNAHGLQQYIVGFQYTLTPREAAELDRLLDLPRLPLIEQVFADAAQRSG